MSSETLKMTLDEGTSDKKLELLEWIFQEMDGWDIFPVKMILPCLRDADGRVCCKALKILSCLAGKGRLDREELSSLLCMIGHHDNLVRETLVEMFLRTRFALHCSNLEELLPLLKHYDRDVRDSVIRLFLEVPYCFDEKLCLRIANSASRENLDIQATVY